jgi:short-subunit dehydrogenase
MHLLQNKIALITGASGGIGAATAKALARKSAIVVLLARRDRELDIVKKNIEVQGGKAYCYVTDLSKPEEVKQTAERIKTEVGIPDIIVNNAGMGRWRAIDETSEEEAVEMMGLPYFAAFYTTRNFIKEMMQKNTGHIINITSPVGFIPIPGALAYGTARWAMAGFSKFLKADLRGTGIRVSLVVPGKVSSTYFEHNPGSEERIPTISNIFPTLSPERVAKSIVRVAEKGHGDAYLPLPIGLTLFTHRLFPGLVEWMMRTTGWKREKQPM